jgi:hypothetical protein
MKRSLCAVESRLLKLRNRGKIRKRFRATPTVVNTSVPVHAERG